VIRGPRTNRASFKSKGRHDAETSLTLQAVTLLAVMEDFTWVVGGGGSMAASIISFAEGSEMVQPRGGGRAAGTFQHLVLMSVTSGAGDSCPTWRSL
jgi:hypothetical protein